MTAARAWRSLLPYAEPADVREWLDERGAFECHRRGVRDVHDRGSWLVVGEVLARLRGEPGDVIEGRLIV